MKTYPYQDGDRLIDLVEKREYDDLLDRLESEKSTRNHIIKRGVEMERELNDARNQLYRICKEGFGNDDTIGLEPTDDYILRKLNDLKTAVQRMEQVTIHDLKITFRKGGAICGLECDAIEAVRNRLIQAAKGEA